MRVQHAGANADGVVFAIPLAPGVSVHGVVLADQAAVGDGVLVCVFKVGVTAAEILTNVDELIRRGDETVLAIGSCLRDRLDNGTWSVVGRVDSEMARRHLRLPYYRVGEGRGLLIESYVRDRVVRDPSSAALGLRFRDVSSSAGLEGALRAFLNIGPNRPHYQEWAWSAWMRYVVMSSLVAEGL